MIVRLDLEEAGAINWLADGVVSAMRSSFE